MNPNCVDKAVVSEKKDKNVHQMIKDVHISVFFDGTNNNMVQHAYYHTFKGNGMKVPSVDKKNDEGYDEYNERKEKHGESLRRQNEIYDQVQEKTKIREKKYIELTALLSEMAVDSSYNKIPSTKTSMGYVQLTTEIKKLDEEIEKLQAETYLDIYSLHSDTQRGFSNVAILHSLLNRQKNTDESIYYDIYVEGSGANDIVATGGSDSGEGNPNGLGFGLGLTGVTALVSKAVKYVYQFLMNYTSYLDGATNYHFYVFGFSRGSTCARLFTELTTRNEKETLPREEEFGQVTSKVRNLYKNGRLAFMENGFLKQTNISREKVNVDFLGIYDTVASIGFLKQKDGWTNALSWGYRMWWWNNYNGNFHYMNAHDYGLYSPQNKRVLHTCHICAGDEFRENFALVNLGRKVPKTAIEVIIPGCHSDVGGGYVNRVEQDIVLYKFVPRKFEHFLKHNKILEILGFFYLKSKERAKMFVKDPFEKPKMDINNSTVELLNPRTLAKLGWIGSEWEKWGEEDNNVKDNYDQDPETQNCFTKRVADWPNEIKFKRYVKQGYSNIPLNMMLKRVEKCGFGWLFNLDTYPYEIPEDLKAMGDEMINLMNNLSEEKRLWIIPEGDYSGNIYRSLRLKYLHFTSSCELWHFRSAVEKEKLTKDKDYGNDKKEKLAGENGKRKMNTPYEGGKEENYIEIVPGNLGNNCNYDNHANICRIMYDGDKKLSGDHEQNVHYLYDFNSKNYGMKSKDVYGDIPKIINKRTTT